MNGRPRIGHACAYTPLPLLDAAGLVPYRMLPRTDAPDRAGACLHDNLCPHVKRVLDRALADDLPPLAGVVLVTSCDAMRRLADAWRTARPGDDVVLLDLPYTADEVSVQRYEGELRRLAARLPGWGGVAVDDDALAAAVVRHDRLADGLEDRQRAVAAGRDDPAALQALRNRAATSPWDDTLDELNTLREREPARPTRGPPVMLTGNVMPDPEAYQLLTDAGCRLVVDDLCTGERMFRRLAPDDVVAARDPWRALARTLLERTDCARTFAPQDPGGQARRLVERARASGAAGVILHTMKFCDPYLARLPALRRALEQAELPLLVLEGDCTLRSLGQQRTRIEAFTEMLGEV